MKNGQTKFRVHRGLTENLLYLCVKTRHFRSKPNTSEQPLYIVYMGYIYQEGYYAKKVSFFLKFAQELLKNGEG